MLEARLPVEAIVQDRSEWLLFSEPRRVVMAERAGDVRAAIREVERLTRDAGWHAVGWVAFEAGQAFDLPVHQTPAPCPLVWFALFEPSSVQRTRTVPPGGAYTLGPVTPSLTAASFAERFARIKAHIGAGDCYQANFTFGATASFRGDPRGLFADLVQAQRGAYSAYVATGDLAVCSASPELFFELDGAIVRTRPMKGTARRGLTTDDDERAQARLSASAKERAENVMIVDMMRNDLGRIADVGSVRVPSLFDVERYPTVWQMTSQVEARSLAPLDEVFAALHPSASVTGAPKVRTLEILASLEAGPRGIYTGAIGYVPPDGNARFNVAIRTAVVAPGAGLVQFGVGSGIVWDSDANAEYDECLLKAAVLGRRPQDVQLLETLRWTPSAGFFVLDRHLARLEASARYFDVPCWRADVTRALDEAVQGRTVAQRVRLLLHPHTGITVEAVPLPEVQPTARVAWAARPVSSDDVWLYHKTTRRQVYDEARKSRPDVDDVLLWNERGELTESTIANVVIELDGERVTPPIACGLLAGTYRAELLARGELREAVIERSRVGEARLWLINSVQEWRLAELVP